jgi:hypothetical protein
MSDYARWVLAHPSDIALATLPELLELFDEQTAVSIWRKRTRLAAEAWQTHPDADPEVADFHDPLLDAW